jgi:hypothetical protein
VWLLIAWASTSTICHLVAHYHLLCLCSYGTGTVSTACFSANVCTHLLQFKRHMHKLQQMLSMYISPDSYEQGARGAQQPETRQTAQRKNEVHVASLKHLDTRHVYCERLGACCRKMMGDDHMYIYICGAMYIVACAPATIYRRETFLPAALTGFFSRSYDRILHYCKRSGPCQAHSCKATHGSTEEKQACSSSTVKTEAHTYCGTFQ